jgi:hypothetical protein
MKPHIVDALRIAIEDLTRRYPEVAEDAILRADMLEAETDIKEVLTGLIRIDKDARGLRDNAKEQLADLKARGERMNRRVEVTRSLMMSILDAAGSRKFELPEATIYLRNNSPAIVGEVDPEKLPDDLVKIERKADRVKVKEALAAGRELDGLALSNAPPSLILTVANRRTGEADD